MIQTRTAWKEMIGLSYLTLFTVKSRIKDRKVEKFELKLTSEVSCIRRRHMSIPSWVSGRSSTERVVEGDETVFPSRSPVVIIRSSVFGKSPQASASMLPSNCHFISILCTTRMNGWRTCCRFMTMVMRVKSRHSDHGKGLHANEISLVMTLTSSLWITFE